MTDIFSLLNEESSEVIQAACKIQRFGINAVNPKTGVANKDSLEEEIGDLIAIIQILIYNNVIDQNNLRQYSAAKIEKLKTWSDLFADKEVSKNFAKWMKENYVI